MSSGVGIHVDELRSATITIAADFFAAMVTGQYGSLVEVGQGSVEFADALHAWVEVQGGFAARALLTTEHSTADLIARALLDMDADEPVTQEDLVDAFGEMANVLGGNIKSLLPEQGRLTLPTVSTQPPSAEKEADVVVDFDWAGRGLRVSLWGL